VPNATATHGVTTTTVAKFAIDAGAVYLNYGLGDERPLGATRGGSTFAIEQEVREMEIDGLPGPLKGARRFTSRLARLETNLVEQGVENLMLALPGSVQAALTNHAKITRDRNLLLSDYITNVALVQEVLGRTNRAIYIVKNVISVDNLEMGTSDDDEVVLTLNLTAHFDPAALGSTGQAEEPWEIRWPSS
jgi:hypothetical protein